MKILLALGAGFGAGMVYMAYALLRGYSRYRLVEREPERAPVTTDPWGPAYTNGGYRDSYTDWIESELREAWGK